MHCAALTLLLRLQLFQFNTIISALLLASKCDQSSVLCNSKITTNFALRIHCLHSILTLLHWNVIAFTLCLRLNIKTEEGSECNAIFRHQQLMHFKSQSEDISNVNLCIVRSISLCLSLHLSLPLSLFFSFHSLADVGHFITWPMHTQFMESINLKEKFIYV